MKNTRTLRFLFSAAMAMTLVSCGGQAQLEKAYITFVTTGENAAVFEKVYDGSAATFDLNGVKTNSDGQLSLEWYTFETGEEGEQVEKKLETGPINAGTYQIVISVPKTNKFEARSVKHSFEITKAALPQSYVTMSESFPEVIYYTQTGSGSRVTRTATADSVAAVKAAITVKDATSTWTADTDYTVAVSVTSATAARVTITAAGEKGTNYSSVQINDLAAELAS